MGAAVSVIVPTLEAAGQLPACAAGLFEGLSEGVIRELVVADGGSGDETRRMADAIGADVVEAEAALQARLAAGVAAARGDWLMFLGVERVLKPGWALAVRAQLEARVPAVLGGRVWFRRASLGQGVLIRAQDYAATRGFDAAGRLKLPRRPVVLEY